MGALAVFGFAVVFLSILLVACMRTKRGFLKQTWKTYDAYLEMKAKDGHCALEEAI